MVQKDACIPMFISVIFTTARTWRHPKCPSTEEWIKKMWCTDRQTNRHTHTMEYYSAVKKNGIMPFAATGMD